MKIVNVYTSQEIEAAKYALKHYRELFPSLEDIQDEVIIEDIYRCKRILATVKVAETTVIVSQKSNDTPWFLKGPKSQNFKKQLEECIQQEAYGEINELYREIVNIKNKYAHERYMKIFEYVMNKNK
jgi:hypothetical protein